MTTPRLAAALAAFALTASCSDTGTSPTTTAQPAAATITPSTAAPAIEALLDLLGPCGVITAEQAQQLGYSDHSDHSDHDPASCTYVGAHSPRQLTIGISRTRLTAQSGSPGDTVAAETVGNHQGVRVQSGTEPTCTFHLDIANRTLTVQATHEETAAQACMRARAAATKVARAVL